MLAMHKIRQQAGDTIVEVMVALAVIGLGIGIAYATASRSLLNTRASQESAEATALLKNETEALRYVAAGMPTTKPIFGGTFCLDTQLDQGTDTATIANNIIPDVNTDCQFNAAGTTSSANGETRYHVQITYDNLTSKAYTLKATWDDVAGNGTDSATLVYRVYQ